MGAKIPSAGNIDRAGRQSRLLGEVEDDRRVEVGDIAERAKGYGIPGTVVDVVDPQLADTARLVLGMALLLASLGMLFAASLAGYLVVRLESEAWPPPLRLSRSSRNF